MSNELGVRINALFDKYNQQIEECQQRYRKEREPFDKLISLACEISSNQGPVGFLSDRELNLVHFPFYDFDYEKFVKYNSNIGTEEGIARLIGDLTNHNKQILERDEVYKKVIEARKMVKDAVDSCKGDSHRFIHISEGGKKLDYFIYQLASRRMGESDYNSISNMSPEELTFDVTQEDIFKQAS